MSCRDDHPFICERWQRFSRALKPEDLSAMDVLIAPVIQAVNGESPCDL